MSVMMSRGGRATCFIPQVSLFFCADCLTVLSAGTSSGGLKYRGTIEVLNLSDENDMDDLDVSPLPVSDQCTNQSINQCIDH